METQDPNTSAEMLPNHPHRKSSFFLVVLVFIVVVGWVAFFQVSKAPSTPVRASVEEQRMKALVDLQQKLSTSSPPISNAERSGALDELQKNLNLQK